MHPRQFRKSKGLTLEQLAEKVGAANASVVSRHELGTTFPTPEMIERYRKFSRGKVRFDDFDAIRKAKRDAQRRIGNDAPPKLERTI